MEKFIYPEFPANDFVGNFIFLVDTTKEEWADECRPAVGVELVCRALGDGNILVPNSALKSIMDGTDYIGTVTVSASKIGKLRVGYNYGGGSASIIFSLKNKQFFNTFDEKDREELHSLYGGKQYYRSCSGLSGAGYLLPSPEENDLVVLPVYRDQITHLSEAWPKEVNGIKMMVPTSISGRSGSRGQSKKTTPIIVMEIDGVICFVESVDQMLRFLTGQKPEKSEVRTWKYKYLNGEISVEYWDYFNRERVTAIPLPYKFHEFVSLFFPQMLERARMDGSCISDFEINGFFEKCLKTSFEGKDAIRFGLFGLPVEDIKNFQDRFIEGQLFSWDTGWVTTKNFLYRRNGEKIYSVYECKGSELSFRFTDELVEYEQEISIFDWFAKPVDEWVSEMRKKAFEKAKNEFINKSRWTEKQQKAKVQELLQKNPETMFVVEDSLATGNCRPGTQSFMDQYGIKEPVSAEALLNHKEFNKMLQNSRFRTVVISKLFDSAEFGEVGEVEYLEDDLDDEVEIDDED